AVSRDDVSNCCFVLSARGDATGQHHRESRAAARLAGHADFSAEQFRQLFHDKKSQADALIGAYDQAVGLSEFFEEPGHHHGLDTDAGVGDGEFHKARISRLEPRISLFVSRISWFVPGGSSASCPDEIRDTRYALRCSTSRADIVIEPLSVNFTALSTRLCRIFLSLPPSANTVGSVESKF